MKTVSKLSPDQVSETHLRLHIRNFVHGEAELVQRNLRVLEIPQEPELAFEQEEQALADFEGALNEPFEAELSGNEVELVVADFTSCEAFDETSFEEGLVVEPCKVTAEDRLDFLNPITCHRRTHLSTSTSGTEAARADTARTEATKRGVANFIMDDVVLKD